MLSMRPSIAYFPFIAICHALMAQVSPAQQPPSGNINPQPRIIPLMSSCGKPVGKAQDQNACDLALCARAEAEIECATQNQAAARKALYDLVNEELDRQFGFDPGKRTPVQTQALDALVNLNEKVVPPKVELADQVANLRDHLKALKDAIAIGSNPASDASRVEIEKAFNTAVALSDPDPALHNMQSIAENYAKRLEELRALSQKFLAPDGPGGRCQEAFKQGPIKEAKQRLQTAAFQLDGATKRMREDCKKCDAATSTPVSTAAGTIVVKEAYFGHLKSKTLKCNATNRVGLRCSRILTNVKLCYVSATNRELKVCGVDDKLTATEYPFYQPLSESSIKQDTCQVPVTADAMCGGIDLALKSSIGPRKGRVSYECPDGRKDTEELSEGELMILDCRPGSKAKK